MGRSHRIVQTRDVCVHQILTAKNHKMNIFQSASLKLGLERAVLAHQRENSEDDRSIDSTSNNKSKPKSKIEMQAKKVVELLKRGYFDVFWDDDDTELQQFMETNIDHLLERSSRTVTYGSSGKSTMSSGLGSFSKASFVV